MPGGQEWILIVVVVVLLFGANKLPKLARSAGSALGEFKQARYQAEQEAQQVKKDVMESEPENVEGETEDSEEGESLETETE